MSIKDNILYFDEQLRNTPCRLIAVTKTHPIKTIQEAYDAGHRLFGENKVQELVEKRDLLPHDIAWHLIGHLQTNKVKYIAQFVDTIQSVDSLKLLVEINKRAEQFNRTLPVNCMLQISIADEETKYGMTMEEAEAILQSEEYRQMKYIRITGVMGIATNTDDEGKLRGEFRQLRYNFLHLKEKYFFANDDFKEISMGMTSDWKIALEEGSTMIRVGSGIFGNRNYNR
ncbi:YggS family pyridoxal phosphate-dependent enzyme [Pontibacter cellulosilyticus]|uniref:Pyridoxal phosphate homeostasis protein n=1 Tax=Pontibacter cellulosilyticus TaxID=1720253 RepID=A0A923N3H8_9BACT|nr:YggS family pyridoxal phosphate-dependent enzyme [Pontibacter cellulosilyticus]MBC5991489.1 YggS family pyridoxal phosphate-dependent enzyme [Pontibacter cellulosilyticus]